ncbi:MAG: transposase [Bacteroidetes bacterium]|nr:transposase [Bacteroidota bacterium]
MPNHIHGLIHIDTWDGTESPEDSRGHGSRSASLSSIVGSLKSAASKIYRQAQRSGSDEIVWQRGFYERIVRDEQELLAARRYIEENPQRWRDDPMYATEQQC